jgi:hypothetical protein
LLRVSQGSPESDTNENAAVITAEKGRVNKTFAQRAKVSLAGAKLAGCQQDRA